MRKQLPPIYRIVSDIPSLQNALANGFAFLQFRAKNLSVDEYCLQARQAQILCANAGAQLMLNIDPSLVPSFDSVGIHLTSERLLALGHRPFGDDRWIGASCHHLNELKHAESIGVDFAVLSPVCWTPTHPDHLPLGWQQFAEWVGQVSLPVYALGGMKLEDLALAQSHGAYGVAGIRFN